MNQQIEDNAIREINARLTRLEKAVFGSESKVGKKKEHKRSARGGLPSHILSLRDERFFKQAKTAKETHTKLQSLYPCDLDRVVMALLRLQQRKQLRKATKVVEKKKRVAYVW